MKNSDSYCEAKFHVAMAALMGLLASGPMCLQAQAQQVAADVLPEQIDELPEIIVDGASIAIEPSRKHRAKQASSTSSSATVSPSSSSQGGGSGTTGATAGESLDFGADQSSGDGSQDRFRSGSGIYQSNGSAVSVLTRQDLEARKIRHAADALRSLPGVQVSRSGGFSGLTQVRLRGAEGNHTKVIIDGIEANDTTNGEFDFALLDAQDIERIEVIRGPQAGLYGSGAVGGVINIVTRQGRGPLSVAIRAEGGSFRTRDAAARVSGGNDQIWGSLSYHIRETDGFDIAPEGSEDDGAKLRTFAFRGGAQLVEGVTLDMTVRRTVKDGDRDTQTFGVSGIQVDDPATFEDALWLAGARLKWESPDGALRQLLSFNYNETRRADNDNALTPFITDNLGERLHYAYQATYNFNTPGLVGIEHSITGLAEFDRESFVSQTYSTSPFFFFNPDGETNRRDRLAFAGEYIAKIANRFQVTGNIRRDDYDDFSAFTTWRAGASLNLSEIGIRPHASVGKSVKFPTMFELFGTIPGFFTPNPDLIPEEGRGWDAGIEFLLIPDSLSLDVTYFESNLKNRISGFFTVDNTPGTSQRDGVEVAARWQLTRNILLGASYTYLDARDPDGVQEIRRPRHAGKAELNYLFAQGRGRLNLTATYNGQMDDTNFGPFPSVVTMLDSYWLVDAALSYQLIDGVEVFGRVNNAFNENYEEIHGFETAGVAAFAGIRFKFGGEGGLTPTGP